MSVRTQHYLVLSCDRCGEPARAAEDGTVLQFASVSEAQQSMKGDWLILANGAAVCDLCLARQECELVGHRLISTGGRPTVPDVMCIRCRLALDERGVGELRASAYLSPHEPSGSSRSDPRMTTPDLPPPTGPELPADYSIAGYQPGHLVSILDGGGSVVGLLPHWARHSPGGFSWGYSGSGPAELARCILIAVIGREACCGTCSGTGGVGPEAAAGEASGQDGDADPCGDCDAGFTVKPSLYHQFKDEVVAGLPETGWTLRVAGVRMWLDAHR